MPHPHVARGRPADRPGDVLVVVDRASRGRDAIDHAAALACEERARLTVAVCLAEFEPARDRTHLEDAVVRGLEARFRALTDPLRDRGIEVGVVTLIGEPFIEIIGRVERYGHDLVVKAGEGEDPGAGPTFGATDLHLLRKCPCPVWVLSPSGLRAQGPVVAALAPEPPGAEVSALNRRILTLASAQARRRRVALDVVQVWTPPDEGLLRYLRWPEARLERIHAGLQAERERMERRFQGLLEHAAAAEGAHAADLAVQGHLLEGAPGSTIVRFAERRDAWLVVLGTTTRSAPGLLIGEVAEDVLRQTACSVLALKPDGFVSPVSHVVPADED
jgi:nucleotide-binding universal stress UspA family protein